MKKLDWKSYEIMEPYYNEFKILSSELSFTNLFLWRNKYNFHFEIEHGFLWVINVKNSDTIYFSQPIGNYNNGDMLMNSIEAMKKKYGQVIIKKTDDRLNEVLKQNAIEFSSLEDRDSFDYIYDFKLLRDLEGKLYHKKKNHINQFLSKYSDWKYEQLSEDNIQDVLEMSDAWFLERDSEDLNEEKMGIESILKYFNHLNYNGGILRVDDRVVAFTFGEMLNEDTLVIHIEKADTKYKGVYAMINQQYLLHQNENVKWVNREQDLGIEGLRRSKLSYQPVGFIEKFIVTLK